MRRLSKRRASIELLLLCTTARVPQESHERISQLVEQGPDWEYLLSLSSFHGVASLLFHSLSGNGFAGQVPPSCMDKLKQAYHQTVYRNAILSAETERVLAAISGRGIGAIPLKGVVLTETLYGNLGLRTISDIDILVQPQDLSGARGCLVERGYHPLSQATVDPEGHAFHGTPYFKKTRIPLFLELHWSLGDKKLVSFQNAEIWRRAIRSQVNGYNTLVLCPEDNLVFLAYHLTKHETHLLKYLCDVAEQVKRYNNVLDWGYIRSSSHSLGASAAVYYSLRRAKEFLGAPVPQPWLEAVRPWPVRWWLIAGLLQPETLVAPAKWESLRRETIALAHSLMMERPRQAFNVLLKRRGGKVRALPRTMLWMAPVFAVALCSRLARVVRAAMWKNES